MENGHGRSANSSFNPSDTAGKVVSCRGKRFSYTVNIYIYIYIYVYAFHRVYDLVDLLMFTSPWWW
jgi:hypothetical protein